MPTNPTSDPAVAPDVDAEFDTELGGDGVPPTRLAPRPDPAARAQERLWWAAAVVWRRRWWIVAAAVVAAVVAAAVVVQIPNRYRAETRVLLPDSGSGLAALLGRSSSAAATLLGGGSGGFSRYLAILTARTTYETVVERFALTEVYNTGEEPDPVAAAVQELSGRTQFDASLDFDYLAVRVLDEDPQRAAQMANTFVEILNRDNTRLSQESASTYRLYLGQRLERAQTDLDSVLAETQTFQERYGVVQPETQGAAFVESLAAAARGVAEAEVAYEAIRSELGDENPQTRTAAAALATARRQQARLMDGSGAVMPVPIGQLPTVGRRYAELQQGLTIQGEILKELQPLYEQALLAERRESDAVQVIDEAVPPAKKAEPFRTLIVLGTGLSAGLLVLVLVLAVAIVRRGAPVVAARLRAAGA